jgi:glycosyltransferase involved in cell wall biosynthesis
LTDTQLKSIYETAKISLIPTKDTLQPSGQSVGLQSISMKIPLIVSESKGFWGKGALEHSKDIFVLKNDLNIWKEVIIKLMEDKSLQKDITENAYIKFQKYFNYEHTFKKFIKIIA